MNTGFTNKIYKIGKIGFAYFCRLLILCTKPFRKSHASKIDISFVVLTWNRKQMLKLTLERLIQNLSNELTYEIIVYDNASTDGTKEFLDEQYAGVPNIRIIHSAENIGLNGYHQLFDLATGELIVETDDDVLDFPENFDITFKTYLQAFPDYAYFALDVIQNEHTTGRFPQDDCYKEETRNNLTVLNGPTGGWCAAFRAKDFHLFDFIFRRIPLSLLGRVEDGNLCFFFKDVLGFKHGVIKGVKCFHAAGDYYTKLYGGPTH